MPTAHICASEVVDLELKSDNFIADVSAAPPISTPDAEELDLGVGLTYRVFYEQEGDCVYAAVTCAETEAAIRALVPVGYTELGQLFRGASIESVEDELIAALRDQMQLDDDFDIRIQNLANRGL
ncbi:MAG: hypothetical protein AAGI53_15775 [Planctomycetota bacterium]